MENLHYCIITDIFQLDLLLGLRKFYWFVVHTVWMFLYTMYLKDVDVCIECKRGFKTLVSISNIYCLFVMLLFNECWTRKSDSNVYLLKHVGTVM